MEWNGKEWNGMQKSSMFNFDFPIQLFKNHKGYNNNLVSSTLNLDLGITNAADICSVSKSSKSRLLKDIINKLLGPSKVKNGKYPLYCCLRPTQHDVDINITTTIRINIIVFMDAVSKNSYHKTRNFLITGHSTWISSSSKL